MTVFSLPQDDNEQDDDDEKYTFDSARRLV
jgi:hypothetical protein